MVKLNNFTIHTIGIQTNENIQTNDKIEYIERSSDLKLYKEKGDIFIIENTNKNNLIKVSVYVNDVILTENINIKQVVKIIVGSKKLLKTSF